VRLSANVMSKDNPTASRPAGKPTNVLVKNDVPGNRRDFQGPVEVVVLADVSD
jgi:hypothetical protein